MSKKKALYFDLISLIRLGDLDIRTISANNPALITEDFFKMLKEFLLEAQNVADALTEISENNGSEDDFRILAEIKKPLENIGSAKFIPVFSEIIDASIKNDKTNAAEKAKNILNDFTLFCKRTVLTAKSKNSEAAFSAQETGKTAEDHLLSYDAHSLKNVLSMLEQMEATRKLRILAVDDAPVILKTITSVLGDEYKVFTLANPAQLKDFLMQITPDLFLLDYKMPELSGFDLIPVIRNFEEHKDTPIIFLTSLGTVDHISASLALGACDFMVKPFQGNILREKVAKHIVRRKLFPTP